jgi:hypothetical protein
VTDTEFPDVEPQPGLWRKLDRSRWLALIATVVIAGGLLAPKVIFAPCFGDPGEVQLTAALGAVGHPPGQAGIITILRAVVLISPLPAYVTVSATNAIFALAVVGILALLQMRTGVNPIIAGICALIFLVDDQFWHLACTPETYATCILLLIGAIWSFMSWLHGGKDYKLWLAIVLFLYLVANRAPTLSYSLPFVAASLLSPRARQFWSKRPVRKVAAVTLIGTACVVFFLAAIWLRDVPGARYNYLDVAHPSLPQFPVGNSTTADKIERLWWLISAKQFDYMFHPTERTVTGQMRWIIAELGIQYWPVMLLTFAIMGTGVRTLWRENRPVALFLLLMLPAGTIPILLIWVQSNTTILPNLLFALAWFLGMGLTRVLEWRPSAVWKVAVVACIGLTVWGLSDGSFMYHETEFDATEFLEAADIESLPPNTIILADSHAIGPLCTLQATGVRPDIDILLFSGRQNEAYLRSVNRPVYTNAPIPDGGPAYTVGDGPLREIKLR